MISCGWKGAGGDGSCVPSGKGGGETWLTDLGAVSVLQQDVWRWQAEAGEYPSRGIAGSHSRGWQGEDFQ